MQTLHPLQTKQFDHLISNKNVYIECHSMGLNQQTKIFNKKILRFFKVLTFKLKLINLSE